MYVNQEFQEAITQQSPRIEFRMTSQKDGEVIESSNGGLMIEAPWEFASDSFVGEFPSWMMKATFMYLGDKKSYVGHEFYCEIGAHSFDDVTGWGDSQWAPIGYFTVDEDGQTTDEIMKQIILTLYDRAAQKTDVKYFPLEFPLTGFQIRQEVATRCGLEFSESQENLFFDEVTFDSLNVSAGQAITDREVLKQYAQLNMASIFIDRYGKLRIESVFNKAAINDGVSNFDYDSLTHEIVYGPVNSLIYSNTATNDDESYQDIESKDDESIEENGKVSLSFSNNIFLDPFALEQQQTYIDSLFDIVNGFSYAPFEISYFARPDFDPYDVIQLIDMSGNIANVPITNMTFNYNGGLTGTLKTKTLPETLSKSDIPNIFERVKNAEFKVDRVNNEITQAVSDVETLGIQVSEQSTQINQNSTVIQQEVIDRVQMGDEILEQMSAQLSLTKDEFSISFEELLNMIGSTDGTLEGVKAYFTFRANGMTIGKSTSPFQVVLSEERLSFVENGNEIAYMSGQTLYITSATVLTSIRLGNHIFEKSTFTEGRTIVRKV